MIDVHRHAAEHNCSLILTALRASVGLLVQLSNQMLLKRGIVEHYAAHLRQPDFQYDALTSSSLIRAAPGNAMQEA